MSSGRSRAACADQLSRLLEVTSVQGDSSHPAVDQSAGPVVVVVGSRHHRQGLLGERVGSGPIVAFDRRDAALGEEHGHERSAFGAGGIHGVGEAGIRPVGVSLEQVGDAVGMEHGGPIRARRGEAVQSDARIAPHLGGTITTEERPQVGQGGLDGVPVRERAGRGGRFGRGRPPLRGARPPDQRMHQRAVHCDRREALDQAVRLEPLHPAQDGVRASTGPHRAGVLQHEAGDHVGVVPRLGMVDGGLRHVVRLAPRGGAVVERADHVRLTPLQLGHQQIPEQVVVAIPLPAAVEWHDEQVSALESLQDRARSLRVERRVAERTAHAVEDRGAGQE